MSGPTEPEAGAPSVSDDQAVKQEEINGNAGVAELEAEAAEETNGSTEVKEEAKSEFKAEATEETNGSTEVKKEATPEIKAEESNGSTEVKEEAKSGVKDEPIEKNGDAFKAEIKQEDRKDVKARVKERKQRTYDDGVLKTSAQSIPGKNNSKYNPELLPVSEDHKIIRAQVEFYFSDSNLPSDNYLWGLTDGASNRPVPIANICSFGRMKRFQPQSNVVAALRGSSFLVVSGPEGGEQVNRKVAYDPTTPASKSIPRSIYAKGFGDEEPSSQFDIEAFFAPYGPTRSVRLRRTDDKLFKGSVFVEFEDEETAEKFMKLDPKPLWKGTHVLKIQTKQDYMEQKEQEIKDGKIQPQLQRYHNGRGRGKGRGRGGDRGGRGDRGNRGNRGNRINRGDRDPDDWKKRREDDRASGFKDNHRGPGGRGGRGGRRDGRGSDQNRGSENKAPKSEENGDDKKPEVKPEVKPEAKSEEVSTSGKRPRENDDGAEEQPAKKVDTKPSVAAEA